MVCVVYSLKMSVPVIFSSLKRVIIMIPAQWRLYPFFSAERDKPNYVIKSSTGSGFLWNEECKEICIIPGLPYNKNVSGIFSLS